MRKRLHLVGPALLAALVLFLLTPIGTRAQNSVLNYFSQPDVNGNNTLNITGAPGLKFGTKATDIDHGSVTLNSSGYAQVTTNLTSTVDCHVSLQKGSAPGLDPYTVTVLYTTGNASIELFAWKATSSGNPTLIASTAGSVGVAWVCFGT